MSRPEYESQKNVRIDANGTALFNGVLPIDIANSYTKVITAPASGSTDATDSGTLYRIEGSGAQTLDASTTGTVLTWLCMNDFTGTFVITTAGTEDIFGLADGDTNVGATATLTNGKAGDILQLNSKGAGAGHAVARARGAWTMAG